MISDSDYTTKSDLWALGLIIYEIYTLEFPFEYTGLQDLAQKIVAGQYEKLPDSMNKNIK